MNNSVNLTMPSDANDCPTPHIRRNTKGLTSCTWREFLLIVFCVTLTTLLFIVIVLYFATHQGKLFLCGKLKILSAMIAMQLTFLKKFYIFLTRLLLTSEYFTQLEKKHNNNFTHFYEYSTKII